MLPISAAVVAATAGISYVQAASPAVETSFWRSTVFQSGDGPFPLTEVNVVFDQDLYINVSGTLEAVGDITGTYGSQNTKWPLIGLYLQGAVQLCCGEVCLNGYGRNDGPPMHVMPLPPTMEPLPTFFGYLGGRVPTTPVVNTKLSVTFLNPWVGHQYTGGNFTMGLSVDEVRQCAINGTFQARINNPDFCPPSFPPQQEGRDVQTMGNWTDEDLACYHGGLYNSAGESVDTVNVTLPADEFVGQCTPETIQLAIDDLREFSEAMKHVETQRDLSSLDFVLATLDLRYGIDACQNLLESMVTFTGINVTIENSFDCPHNDDSSEEWKADPCCNWFDTQCCAPKDITKEMTTIDEVLIDNVTDFCPGNEGSVIGALYAYIQSLNSAGSSSGTTDVWQLYDEYRKPMEGCLWGLWGSPCQADSDCYSLECNTENNECVVPSNITETFFRCGVANFDIQVIASLRRTLQIPPGFLTNEQLVGNFTQFVESEYLQEDCVGRSSWSHSARQDWQKDDSGNWEPVIIPANETGCLSDQSCNWYWGHDEEQCENSSSHDYFCGQCNEGDCWEVSQFPKCEIGQSWNMDESTCTTLGGVYTEENEWWSYCAHPNASAADSLESCFEADVCPGSGSPDEWIRDSFEDSARWGHYWQCNSPMCYTPALNETECWQVESQNDTWVWFARNWANGTGVCQANLWDAPASEWQGICDSYGWELWTGRTYQDGRYHTQALCEEPVCHIPGVGTQEGLTEEECLDEFACDQSCPACVSSDDTEKCLTPHRNSTACATVGGEWEHVNGTSDYACVVEISHQACTANDWMPVNCSVRATEDSCHDWDLDYSPLLQCYWNHAEPCPTLELCEAKGQCNDWEFTDWDNCEWIEHNVTGQYDMVCPGRCVFDFPILPNGAKMLQCGMPLGDDGYPDWDEDWDDQWWWSRLGCISTNYTDSTTCEAAGGNWYLRADSQSECEAHGVGCKVQYRGEAAPFDMNGTDCADCHGREEHIYTWSPGRQRQGEMISYQWKLRDYDSVNDMKPVVPWYEFQGIMDSAIIQVMATQMRNDFEQKNSLKFNIYQSLATSCQGDNGTMNNASSVILAAEGSCECVADVCTGVCDITCSSDACSFDTYSAAASTAADWTGSVNRRRLADSSAYSVIYDWDAELIGQLIGNGKQLNGTLPDVYELCLSIDALIDQDTNYTVYDFADGETPGLPLNLTIEEVGDTICANVSGTDLFWPILRKENDVITWDRAVTTGSPTPEPTIEASSTASPTIANARTSGASATLASFNLVVLILGASIASVMFV